MLRLTLDDTLAKQKMACYELSKKAGIQYQIIDSYYKSKVKRHDSFVRDRICSTLNCEIQDILSYTR